MKTKLKVKGAAKKRFKLTGTGKVKRRKAGMRHLLEHRSAKTKRGKLNCTIVAKADIKKIKQLLKGRM